MPQEVAMVDSVDDGEFRQFYSSLNEFLSLSEEDSLSRTSVSRFLRNRCLSFLRNSESFRPNIDDKRYRDCLIQWWVALLNFLGNNGVSENESSVSDEIELISVNLECMSKIITGLAINSKHTAEDAEIYSYHLLITVRFAADQLIVNSKSVNNSSVESFRKLFAIKYDSLLRTFLGKLIAYSFFYLSDTYNFDNLVMSGLVPDTTFESGETLFHWKKKHFIKSNKCRHETQDMSKDTKCFKIVISYLKNDFIFFAFYWNYWYITINYLPEIEIPVTIDNSEILQKLPGSEVLFEYVIDNFYEFDIMSLAKFIISKNPNKSKGVVQQANNETEIMPNSTSSFGEKQSQQDEKLSPTLTSEDINNFIMANFKSLKLWECLRTLAGCFGHKCQNLLKLHDEKQLKYVSSFSAYDSRSGNIFFNKILQFIVFQFSSMEDLDFIHWNNWVNGLLMMLRTLQVDSQTSALVSLFNFWKYIPIEQQNHLSNLLVTEFWPIFITDNSFQVTKLLYLFLVVFKVSITSEESILKSLINSLQSMYLELALIKKKYDDFDCPSDKNVANFYGCMRFTISVSKPVKESTLIMQAITFVKNKINPQSVTLFPSITNSANARPSTVLKNGQYPYDVLDLSVVRSNITLSDQENNKNHSKSDPSDTNAMNEIKEASEMISSMVTSAFSSWFSKPKADESLEKPHKDASHLTSDSNSKQSLSEKLPIELNYSKSVAKSKPITVVLKAVELNDNPIFSKLRSANKKWGIKSKVNTNKPLPPLKNHDVDALVKEVNLMGLGGTRGMKFDFNFGEQAKEDDPALKPNFHKVDENGLPIPAMRLLTSKENDNSLNLHQLALTVNNNNNNNNDHDHDDKDNARESYMFNGLSESEKTTKQKNYEVMVRMEQNSKFTNIANTIHIFNEIVAQFYEAMDFIDNDTLFLDFDRRENKALAFSRRR